MSEATPTVEGGPPSLAAHPPDALAEGARLAEFEIRRVLGAGGFGIVYLAWDHALEREVALKEYMPVTLAGRSPDQRVTLRAPAHQETFALGLRSFVNEARLLARFDHPSLVKVYRFWEANGTAYMAMPMYHGRTLRQVRQQMPPGSPGEAWCRALLEPLLGALEALHREGVYHRDIAPDNIVLPESGKPVLLDFGAARKVIGDRTHALTAILKPHFAPIEQYADVASMRQGPWTDLYGLAATCYYLLTGQAPLPAAARALHDELPSLARLAPAGCSPGFLAALDWAMAVRPQRRPQSVASWRDVLEGRTPAPVLPKQDVTTPGLTTQADLAPRSPAEFEATMPMPTAPRPPGSSPAADAVWRGFTVPGGVPTVQPAPPAALPSGPGPVLAGVGAVSSRGRRWWAAALAGGALVGLAVALTWHAPLAEPAPPPSSAAAHAEAPVEASPRPVAVQASPQPAAAPPAAAPLAAAPPAAARPAPATAAMVQAAVPAASAPLVVLPGDELRDAALQVPRTPTGRERLRQRERGSHVAAATVAGPGERCADRMFLTRLICMQQACDSDPRLRHHPECQQMQKAEQERRERILQR